MRGEGRTGPTGRWQAPVLGLVGKGKCLPASLLDMVESFHPVAALVMVESENLLTKGSGFYLGGIHYIWLFASRTSETVVPACFDKDSF